MPKFAILKNDIVQNIIIVSSLEEATTIGDAIQYVDENPAIIGYKYDKENNKFLEVEKVNANL